MVRSAVEIEEFSAKKMWIGNHTERMREKKKKKKKNEKAHDVYLEVLVFLLLFCPAQMIPETYAFVSLGRRSVQKSQHPRNRRLPPPQDIYKGIPTEKVKKKTVIESVN